MQVLIGADPEVFVRNTRTFEFLSGHDIIPGTKSDPHKVPCGAIQVDGCALEFNVLPCTWENEFVHSTKSILSNLRQRVSGYQADLALCISPVASFKPDYFKTLPKEVRRLGCDPDYDAYSGRANQIQEEAESIPFRTASGHIHVGWTQDKDVNDDDHFNLCCEVTKQLDKSLLFPSFLFDSDQKRRELYGKPGAFRPKSYGVEYRVLSNQWLKQEKYIRWVFSATKQAVHDFHAGIEYSKELLDQKMFDTYHRICIERDQEAANVIIEQILKEYVFMRDPNDSFAAEA